MQQPSVGRVVHYVSYGEFGRACQAAVITEVIQPEELAVGLCVLSQDGMRFGLGVSCDEGEPLKPGEARAFLCGDRDYPGGSWHWPARV